ncbi:MAG: hypothetical protein WCI73_17115, partial [Phycisphaerae bacterium]
KVGLVLIMVLLVVLTLTPFAEARSQPFGTELEDKTFTQKIWADRQLDPVEGIWAIKSNWSTLQIAITRNTTEIEKESEYLGIILQKSGNNLWVNGDICLLIKKSINPTYFNATWLIPNLFGTQRLPSSVVLSTAGDVFESSIPGAFGQVYKYTGSKLYPLEGQGVPNLKNVTGTGFFVTPTLVVTNAHVVEGGSIPRSHQRADQASTHLGISGH